MEVIVSKNLQYLFLYITLKQEIFIIKDVNFNCKISFFSDTPVRSEWSELQNQEQCEQRKPEVSPFGIGTAIAQYFCSFVLLIYLTVVCYNNLP